MIVDRSNERKKALGVLFRNFNVCGTSPSIMLIAQLNVSIFLYKIFANIIGLTLILGCTVKILSVKLKGIHGLSIILTLMLN